jgi:hypothetical protein
MTVIHKIDNGRTNSENTINESVVSTDTKDIDDRIRTLG